MMLMLAWMGAARAVEVEIGQADGISQGLPCYTKAEYALSEQIYLKEEIGMTGDITSVSFHTASAPNGEVTRNLDIYIDITSLSAFVSNFNHYFQGTHSQCKVFSGLVTFKTGEWTKIMLDTPKKYTGTTNLMLIVVDNTGEAVTDAAQFSAFETTGSVRQGVGSYGSNAYDPTDLSLMSQLYSDVSTTKKNCVKFGFGEYEAPKDLTVTGISLTSATIGWTSNASEWEICVNGDENNIINTVDNPFILTGLNEGEAYEVKVRVVKDGNVSEWSDAVSFTTLSSSPDQQVEISYELSDSYGDGWNDAAIAVYDVLTNALLATWTISSGSSASGSLNVSVGSDVRFEWVNGRYDSECSYTVYNADGEVIFSGSGAMKEPVVYTVKPANPFIRPIDLEVSDIGPKSAVLSWTERGDATQWQISVNDEEQLILADSNPFTLTGLEPEANYTVRVRSYRDESSQSPWSNTVSFTTLETCPKPTDLAADDITKNGATLTWKGTNDSYLLRYWPWEQVGEDRQSTASYETYTFDLSAYSGTGSIAIRHYNVSDMFRLNVDDIVVTDAEGATVFSEDFDSCNGNLPASLSNIDLDGDGFVWEVVPGSSSNVIGDYGVFSASYDNYSGRLTPDNWLVISGVPLGGTISFKAIGQDANYPSENFGVFVSSDADLTEVPVSGTSYSVNNLTPGTAYSWQVSGISGSEQSPWVSSMFSTLETTKVFAASGNWNDPAKWQPEGVPTIGDKVSIEAAVTIPSGVVAVAGKVKLGEYGSITIEDGGELKHSSATLPVTMKKDIAAGKYVLLASPFAGRTQLSTLTDWSNVENILENSYDLYAFDATEELEWINYKKDPEHYSFMSPSNNNPGINFGEGYLYRSDEERTLTYVGTAVASNNNTSRTDVDLDASSTDKWNGWRLVGNMYTCTGYVSYQDTDGNLLDATFYKLNDTGNGFEVYEGVVELAPCEGAFIQVSTSGRIIYSSEKPDGAVISHEPGELLLNLPEPGLEENQDADKGVVDVATGISGAASVDGAAGEWYTIDGRKLSGKPTKKGLYILNGRKAVVD